MDDLAPVAPLPVDAPIPSGTPVTLDRPAIFHDRNMLAGGAPWRLLRLPGASRAIAQRWRDGDEVRPGEERFARTLVQQGLVHPRFRPIDAINDVDLIIPVRDDVASLRSLLSSVRHLNVTVVDDGSRSPALIEQCARHYGVSLVRLESNRGPGGARNAGASATDCEFLWFIDVDVELDNPDDVLRRLMATFADPLVAAVAPRIRGGVGTTPRDRFERHFSPLDMGARSGLVVPGGAIGYVPSANLVVRRAAFGPGFDEGLRVGEDVDLVWRLHDRGWLVRFLADVTVTHRARGTWRHWFSQRVGYGRSSAALAQRHGARLAPFRCDAWTFVAWVSVLARSPVLGLRIARAARNALAQRLAGQCDDPREVANAIVRHGMLRAGGPLSRSIVRSYGPVLLVAALHPRLRARSLSLFALGTVWRWRHANVHATDIPLGVADDLAYGVGVVAGALSARSMRSLTPDITKSTLGVRDILGLRRARVQSSIDD